MCFFVSTACVGATVDTDATADAGNLCDDLRTLQKGVIDVAETEVKPVMPELHAHFIAVSKNAFEQAGHCLEEQEQKEKFLDTLCQDVCSKIQQFGSDEDLTFFGKIRSMVKSGEADVDSNPEKAALTGFIVKSFFDLEGPLCPIILGAIEDDAIAAKIVTFFKDSDVMCPFNVTWALVKLAIKNPHTDIKDLYKNLLEKLNDPASGKAIDEGHWQLELLVLSGK